MMLQQKFDRVPVSSWLGFSVFIVYSESLANIVYYLYWLTLNLNFILQICMIELFCEYAVSANKLDPLLIAYYYYYYDDDDDDDRMPITSPRSTLYYGENAIFQVIALLRTNQRAITLSATIRVQKNVIARSLVRNICSLL